jgi:hypothetical protein
MPSAVHQICGTKFPTPCCPSRLPQWPVMRAWGAKRGFGIASPLYNRPVDTPPSRWPVH